MSPSDGRTPLADEAAQMHELFITLVGAGFTHRQALYLIACMFAETTAHLNGESTDG